MLDRLILSRFRNHGESLLDGTAPFNLLVGENGAGKTNVLEALSLFAPGRGLRRAALADMATGGEGGFAVSAELLLADGERLRLGTGTSADRPGRRLVQVNGAESSAFNRPGRVDAGYSLSPNMPANRDPPALRISRASRPKMTRFE